MRVIQIKEVHIRNIISVVRDKGIKDSPRMGRNSLAQNRLHHVSSLDVLFDIFYRGFKRIFFYAADNQPQ